MDTGTNGKYDEHNMQMEEFDEAKNKQAKFRDVSLTKSAEQDCHILDQKEICDLLQLVGFKLTSRTIRHRDIPKKKFLELEEVQAYLLDHGIPNISELSPKARHSLRFWVACTHVPATNFTRELPQKILSNEESENLLLNRGFLAGKVFGNDVVWFSPEAASRRNRGKSLEFGHHYFKDLEHVRAFIRDNENLGDRRVMDKRDYYYLRLWAAFSSRPLRQFAKRKTQGSPVWYGLCEEELGIVHRATPMFNAVSNSNNLAVAREPESTPLICTLEVLNKSVEETPKAQDASGDIVFNSLTLSTIHQEDKACPTETSASINHPDSNLILQKKPSQRKTSDVPVLAESNKSSLNCKEVGPIYATDTTTPNITEEGLSSDAHGKRSKETRSAARITEDRYVTDRVSEKSQKIVTRQFCDLASDKGPKYDNLLIPHHEDDKTIKNLAIAGLTIDGTERREQSPGEHINIISKPPSLRIAESRSLFNAPQKNVPFPKIPSRQNKWKPRKKKRTSEIGATEPRSPREPLSFNDPASLRKGPYYSETSFPGHQQHRSLYGAQGAGTNHSHTSLPPHHHPAPRQANGMTNWRRHPTIVGNHVSYPAHYNDGGPQMQVQYGFTESWMLENSGTSRRLHGFPMNAQMHNCDDHNGHHPPVGQPIAPHGCSAHPSATGQAEGSRGHPA